MTPADVRDLLEGYCLEEVTSYQRAGDLTAGSAAVANVDTSGLKPLMKVSGTGVPAGAVIESVGEGALVLSAPATATAAGAALTVTTFLQLSDDWLAQARDHEVVPWVESKVGFALGSVGRAVEYHSGTGSSLVFLDRRPVVEVHSVNLVTSPDGAQFLLPGSFDVVAEQGLLKMRATLESWQQYVASLPRGKYNVKVDYSYGFAEVPCDLARAVNLLVASRALGHLGARTGGGSPQTPGGSRNYGPRGKYGDVRADLERWALAALRRYLVGVVGS
jgi:hypothetical protein